MSIVKINVKVSKLTVKKMQTVLFQFFHFKFVQRISSKRNLNGINHQWMNEGWTPVSISIEIIGSGASQSK